MLKYIREDIIGKINPDEKTLIAHGCNCINTMGKGLAKHLKTNYPGVYDADKKTIKADRSKLGTYSVYRHNDNLIFLNCYTQFGIFSINNQVLLNYKALTQCLLGIARNYRDWKIRLPKIGCGLAKGDWPLTEKIIEEIVKDYNLDVTIYTW